jgi:hypothetical protein
MFVPATEDQAIASLRAAATLVDPPGAAPPSPTTGMGQTLLIAASQLFFSPPVDVSTSDLPPIAPETLARVIGRNPDLAQHVASLLAVASLADGRLDDDRLRRVVEYAHHLGVHDGWVRDVLEIARGHMAWTMADMARRNVATFPGWGDGQDHLPPMLPYQEQTDDDKRLAARFLELETKPATTFGRHFFDHFRGHRFGFPGEYDAFTGAFAVPHDSLHVISGYSTSLQGEILVSTFTGGMHRPDNLRAHILPVIIEWHVGSEVNGIGAQKGNLDPAKFLVAWERGQHTSIDALSPLWDFWSLVDKDLEEVRSDMSVEPLPEQYKASGEEILGR